jgi:hypothetical protein
MKFHRLGWIVAFSWAPSSALAQVAHPFPSERFFVAGAPMGVAAGDLDQDGLPDLVVAIPSGSIALFRGTAAGGLAALPPVANSFGQAQVALGDLNGDGLLDLVSCSGTAQVRFGNGLGGFGAPTTLGTNADLRRVRLVDVDGDGDLDLAGLGGSSTVRVWFNNGAGVLQGQMVTNVAFDCSDFAFGDFDADGRLDVALSQHPGAGVRVLRGTGVGTFVFGGLYAGSESAGSIEAGDLDGDGDIDLALAGRVGEELALLFNDGNGGFASSTSIPLGAPARVVSIGDFDGDGRIDASATTTIGPNGSSGRLYVVRGQGGGAFSAPEALRTYDDAQGVAWRDFDGDGHMDVAVSGGTTGDVSLTRGHAFGDWPTTRIGGEVQGRAYSTEIADIDADGVPDAVFSNLSDNTFEWARGDGLGNFASAGKLTSFAAVRLVRAADLDGDGDVDLVSLSHVQPRVCVHLATAPGVFTPFVAYPVGDGGADLRLADLDADGNLDLVVCNELSNNVSVRLGDGTGAFGALSTFGVGAAPRSVEVADFNGDGRLDLVTANFGAATLSVLPGVGGGAFGAPLSVAAQAGAWRVLAADFNGDGAPDLAVTSGGPVAELRVWLNNGAGGFANPQSYATGQSPFFLHAADVDGDGALDLLYGTSALVLQLGDGLGGFGAPRRFMFSPYWIDAAADLDLDGTLDLIGTGSDTYDLSNSRIEVMFGLDGSRVEVYCTAGVSSAGCAARISSTGVASASAAAGFAIAVQGLEGQRQGLVFYGTTGRASVPWGASSSLLCVKSPTQRSAPQNSGGVAGNCDGVLSFDFNAFATANPGALGQPFAAGHVLQAQGWYRDPPSTKGTALSDALEFDLAP